MGVATTVADERGGEERVLVVEDDPYGARLVEEWLRDCADPAYSVAVASRLAEAVAWLKANHADIIVADLSLPDATGMETIDFLAAAAPTVPLVVLSGNDDEAMAFEAVRHGCQDYLIKGHTERHHLRLSLHYARERKRLELALAESENRFRDFATAASDWFWEMGPDLTYNYVSPTFRTWTGIPTSEMLGKRRDELVLMDPGSPEWKEHVELLLRRQPFQNFEYRMSLGGGSHFVRESGIPLFDAKGEFRGYRGVGTEITRHKELEERIRHMAHHDPLTNLPNRILFQDRLQVAAAQCKRRQAMVAILYLDLDGFKAVNDEYGHEAGDALLKVVAERLGQCIRDGDTLARLGGDEFAIIAEVRAESAVHEVSLIGKRILDRVAAPVMLDQGEAQVSASIGGSFFPKDSPAIDGCLRLADMCMYAAKKTGKNKLIINELDRGDNDPTIQPITERRQPVH
jgi:diguanylate cyclase (GGDEF)-like protein/PAS domain S-box-containing protein